MEVSDNADTAEYKQSAQRNCGLQYVFQFQYPILRSARIAVNIPERFRNIRMNKVY